MISLDLLASMTAFGLMFILYLKVYYSRSVSRLCLPPGPKKLPIIGNLLDMPESFEWETYRKWSFELGSDIIHIDLAGTHLIVLNSAEAAIDLLEKRSSVYSSRARMPMMNELMKWSFNFGFMPYGDYWRQCRRLFHQEFHPVASKRFHPKELKATHGLLRKLFDQPDDLMNHLRHMAGEVVLGIAYGLTILPKNDPYIKTAEEGVHPLVLAGVPGTFLVDALPILKYIPEWFPGASFQRKARHWAKLAERMCEMPFQAAKREIEMGVNAPSFTSYCLEKIDDSCDVAQQEKIIQSTAGTMYAAGSDTTVSFLASFILGMMENPAALAKAHAELDAVLGGTRLPDFDDEKSLPYITAIVKEVLRWRPVTPIAVPHLTTTDDVFRGYRIPKGSIIIPNAWAMLHDENVYPDAFTFNPDRFMKDGGLNKAVKDPAHAAFGFGRRICPGRYMATDSVWIAVASLLAVYDIKKPVDYDGKIIEPSHEYQSALVCMPLPFKYSIKPRSSEAEALIRSTTNYIY